MSAKPNVLVAGFSRCATTYLYNLLAQHPDIQIPPEKEINYLHKRPLLLSHPNLINPKHFLPRSWYFRKFDAKKPVTIDFSVMTAYDLGSAQYVRSLLGDIKIIFITRNVKDHRASVIKTIENHGENIPPHVERFSDFSTYIAPYVRLFSQVLTITKEDLEKHPRQTLDVIERFLKIKSFPFNLEVYTNPSGSYYLDKHGSRFKFLLFRIKRTLLKTLSRIIGLVV